MDTCCVSNQARQMPLVVSHPLQPLTPEEIRQAAAILRKHPPYGDDTRFETIELMEPDKATVRAFSSGLPIGSTCSVRPSSV
jgi:primary-amine oxidase